MGNIDNPNHLSEDIVALLPDFICESVYNQTRTEVAELRESVSESTLLSTYQLPAFFNHDIPSDEQGHFNPGIGRFFQQIYTLNPDYQEQLLPLMQEYAESIGYSSEISRERLVGEDNDFLGFFPHNQDGTDQEYYQGFKDFVASRDPNLAQNIIFGNLGKLDEIVSEIQNGDISEVVIRIGIGDFTLDDGTSYLDTYFLNDDRSDNTEFATRYINVLLSTDPLSIRDYEINSGLESSTGEVFREYISQKLGLPVDQLPRFRIEYYNIPNQSGTLGNSDIEIILRTPSEREKKINDFINQNSSDIYLIDASGSMLSDDALFSDMPTRWDLVQSIRYPTNSQLFTFSSFNQRGDDTCQSINKELTLGGQDPINESLMSMLPQMKDGASITIVSDGQVSLPDTQQILEIAKQKGIKIYYIGIRFGMPELQDISIQTGGAFTIIK